MNAQKPFMDNCNCNLCALPCGTPATRCTCARQYCMCIEDDNGARWLYRTSQEARCKVPSSCKTMMQQGAATWCLIMSSLQHVMLSCSCCRSCRSIVVHLVDATHMQWQSQLLWGQDFGTLEVRNGLHCKGQYANRKNQTSHPTRLDVDKH